MMGVCKRIVLCCLCWQIGIAAWADDSGFVLKEPVVADFNAILNSQASEVGVFFYQGRQSIVLIDFPDLSAQGRMFNRLVALIERIGAPRERVLSNEELAGFIRSTGSTESNFAYGNDFLVSELVVFFNLADLGSVVLTAEELALRQFLIDQKLMVMRMGFYQALRPRAVVLSLPQVKAPVTPLARRTILAHELAHAEFYTNAKYAGYCRYFWAKVMSEAERESFRQFLGRSGYNPENREMMINEMQAYLMHTPDERAFSPKRLGLNAKQVDALRQKFRDGYPDMVYGGL
ncbi:MAG: hypothetical protein H6R18_2745 [Proteobacteria bacterium]|nr:hypothetical protein [Pseudomonadota bacterium]